MGANSTRFTGTGDRTHPMPIPEAAETRLAHFALVTHVAATDEISWVAGREVELSVAVCSSGPEFTQ